MEFRGLFQDNI